MLFNSYAFIFAFLPIALLGYYLLARWNDKAAKIWMIAASFYFYSYWSLKNLPILLTSIGVNYLLNRLLHQELKGVSRQTLFRLGLFFNVGLLGFFKYADFAIWNVNWILQSKIEPLSLALPLGISFFTLQQVGLLVDCYEGLTKEESIIDYAFFVSFFPQLVSGPIVHYSHFMPQAQKKENQHFQLNNFTLGVLLFTLGLMKKVLVAETFAVWAKPAFDEMPSPDLLAAWKASLSYTFQLYFDFSGYTDMALGIGHMFNLSLPQNFNSPFRSRSIIEFWSRWHITLSQFINSYLFTPIVRAMPEINFRNTMIATFLAMFIAGVWHGAGWTFVVYGALHGAGLVINHWRKKKKKKKFSPALAVFVTFNFVNVTFVVFRSKTLAASLKMFKGMLGLNGVIVPRIGVKSVGPLAQYGFKMGTYLYPADYLYLVTMLVTFYVVMKGRNSLEWEKDFSPTVRVGILCGLGFGLCLFGMNRITEFIYFNF
jgi:D-alanyl-lipoteichoic acid acyltransferase DltB (MBOAT superfamily)